MGRHPLRRGQEWCAGQFTFPARVPLTDEVKDLLGRMIEVDPQRRASMSDIQVASCAQMHAEEVLSPEANGSRALLLLNRLPNIFLNCWWQVARLRMGARVSMLIVSVAYELAIV